MLNHNPQQDLLPVQWPAQALKSSFPLDESSFRAAAQTLRDFKPTPLTLNANLSRRYNAMVYLKREDLQVVRSYKIRGAYNKISSLKDSDLAKGVVCSSAGNHAQGVAFSCRKLGIRGLIFMPATTPAQKVSQVQLYGGDFIDIVLIGDTYDDCYNEALKVCSQRLMCFIHPFDDWKVIEGQGTIGLEIIDELKAVDIILLPVGGGGLGAGITLALAAVSPQTRIIGVEPQGAASMQYALGRGEVSEMPAIDKFVDGAAVRSVGFRNFEVFRSFNIEVTSVPEGKICSTILSLYNEEAIVAEPAGALTIAALDQYRDQIEGKVVVCVLSGGNNDITRTQEIRDRSMLYEGLKHYFTVSFAQRAGALREFLEKVLGPQDDIVHFEYTKKSSREKGTAVVGLELRKPADLKVLLSKMDAYHMKYEYLNDKPQLLHYLI